MVGWCLSSLFLVVVSEFPHSMAELSWFPELSQCSCFDFSVTFRRTNPHFVHFVSISFNKMNAIKKRFIK